MKPKLACIVVITLFSAIGVSCYSAQQSSRDLGDDFNAYVEKTMHEWGASGAMIVVVEGDQTVYMKGHGSRIPDENQPINESTVIQVASHTKPVTATAIAMLITNQLKPLNHETLCYFTSLTWNHEFFLCYEAENHDSCNNLKPADLSIWLLRSGCSACPGSCYR